MIVNETAKSLEEQVYLSLEEAIIAGEYKTGDSLTEMSLSKKLGVSRTPIRAALTRLSKEGLVEIAPNRGAVVVGVTDEDLSDVYRIRIRLEGLASAMAAARISENEKKELLDTLELSEFYLNKGDTEKLKELDTAFHRIIYKASGSRVICNILSDLHQNIRTYRKLSLTVPGRLERSINEHREIYEAIAAGNADIADRLTSEHIEQAMQNTLAAIKGEC